MTQREMAQKKLGMVEFYLATKCSPQFFIEEFNVTLNQFYVVRRIANNPELYGALQAKATRSHKIRDNASSLLRSDEELHKILVAAVVELIERGNSLEKVARIFNRSAEIIIKLYVEGKNECSDIFDLKEN